MGYWLKRLLHTESSVVSDEVYRYKLPTVGFYSAFSVQLRATRYQDRAEVTSQDWLRDAITKIEITEEGTKVIKSMRGAELNALNTFDFKQIPRFKHGESDTETNWDTLYLLAGRSLRDKKWMFDMSRFSDPELAITNAIRQDAARGFDDTSLQYKIFGWRWMGDPRPNPIGYFRADERLHYDTTGAAVIKDLVISTGKRIRRILVKGWEERVSIGGHFTKLELKVNEGEYSPIVIDDMVEAALQNKLEYGLDLHQNIAMYLYTLAATHFTDAFIPYHSSAVGQLVPARRQHFVEVAVGNGVLDGVLNHHDAGAVTASWMEVWCDGAGFQRAILLGFDLQPELEDMLETRDMGKLELEITEQSSGDTVSVVVEEEILY